MGLRVNLGVCALAVGLGGNAWAAPNYIVIIADDLGSDKMEQFAWNGGTGEPNFPDAPALETLGNAGLRFTDAWANPLCSPTRASLNTGKYAWQSGIGKALSPMDTGLTDVATLPTMLNSVNGNNYQTALFGKWHLGHTGYATTGTAATWTTTGWKGLTTIQYPPPMGRDSDNNNAITNAGYDYFDGYLGGEVDSYGDWEHALVAYNGPGDPGVPNGDWWRVVKLAGDPAQEYADQEIVDAAETWIDSKVGGSDPWMAIVALAAPHSSASGYVEEDAALDVDCDLLGGLDTGLINSDYACLANADPDDCEPKEIYQALVECMDERIYKFLDALSDEHGRAVRDNTIIVFMGDNGTPYEVMETPYSDPEDDSDHDVGKGQVYQSGVRVPFIMASFNKYVGCTAPTCPNTTPTNPITAPAGEISSLVHVWDLYATMVEAAGGDEDNGAVFNTDSVSLDDCFTSLNKAACATANLSNTTLTPRFHYAETFDVSPTDGTSKASVGVMVTNAGSTKNGEYAMTATYTPNGGSPCMTTELFKLRTATGTLVDMHQVNPLTSGVTGYDKNVCETVRGNFTTANASWMPRSGGSIVWCSGSCP